MTHSSTWKLGLGLAVAFALCSAAMLSTPAHDGDDDEPRGGAANAKITGPRPRQTVLMPKHLAGIELALGLKDEQPSAWSGDLKLSEGRVVGLEILRGDVAAAKLEGNRFTIQTDRAGTAKKAAAKKNTGKKNTAKKNAGKKNAEKQNAAGPMRATTILALIDAPADADLTITTSKGNVTLRLVDLPASGSKSALEGAIAIARQPPSVRLTPSNTEDDHPALAQAPDGSAWLAHVEYHAERPRLDGTVAPADFDTDLVPRNHGDRILLRHLADGVWEPAIVIAEGNLDVWRPTVAVSGDGIVHVAWAEQKNGNWDIFTREYQTQTKALSEITRLTDDPGSDFHVVAAGAKDGGLWLAWQAWRDGNYEVLARSPRGDVSVVSNSKADDWSPAIAVDAMGNAYVVWDTYDQGNFDVRLRKVSEPSDVVTIADSARFEARASVACDRAGRVWVAFESGDEQWGKDYANATPERVPIRQGGFALYINRAVRLVCLADGKLMEPAIDAASALRAAYGERNMSLPRLTADAGGGVWMLTRHHPLPGGAGETWISSALRYHGGAWSMPREIPNSLNLLDNRPAAIPNEGGLLVVGSSDARVSNVNRGQNDLFAARLAAGPGAIAEPVLKPVQAAPAPEFASVHANETADKQRIRAYRIDHEGKSLRLARGEFHRHTEYSSHRDGDGLLEDSWRYALDAVDHDWMGNGDHMNGGGHEYAWWTIQKMADLHLNPSRFVSVHSYERSVVFPSGHRNVIMPRRGIRPLPMGPDRFGTPEDGSPDVKNLYAYLKHFGGMCASHTSVGNMGTDWRDHDPEVEPVVEIYQGHRHNYEHFGAPRAPTAETQIGGWQPAGFIWNALEKGYKLGFESSSDHVSTHLSFAIVLTDDLSRPGIIAAFKKRHSYAATDNIILDVRSGKQLMGDTFTTPEKPTLRIVAHGTAPIAKLHVIRDNKYVFTTEPNQQRIELRYNDDSARPGETHYYYVRVEQADGNLAWASPMWITFGK